MWGGIHVINDCQLLIHGGEVGASPCAQKWQEPVFSRLHPPFARPLVHPNEAARSSTIALQASKSPFDRSFMLRFDGTTIRPGEKTPSLLRHSAGGLLVKRAGLWSSKNNRADEFRRWRLISHTTAQADQGEALCKEAAEGQVHGIIVRGSHSTPPGAAHAHRRPPQTRRWPWQNRPGPRR